MKNINIVLYAIIIAHFLSFAFAKPMESVTHYNVILVHGAADSNNGFKDECSDKEIPDAYTFLQDYILDNVPEDELKLEITNELFERDYAKTIKAINDYRKKKKT